MEGSRLKEQKTGRNVKKMKHRNKVPCEIDGICDANYDTKSYRIYGNPKGEGFAIEEKFRRAGEDGKHEERKVAEACGIKESVISEGGKYEKHKIKEAKTKKKSV